MYIKSNAYLPYMCGQARKIHLKKCSVSLGVSTERMLQLVKDQETEREHMLAAGVLPRAMRWVLGGGGAHAGCWRAAPGHEVGAGGWKAIGTTMIEE